MSRQFELRVFCEDRTAPPDVSVFDADDAIHATARALRSLGHCCRPDEVFATLGEHTPDAEPFATFVRDANNVWVVADGLETLQGRPS